MVEVGVPIFSLVDREQLHAIKGGVRADRKQRGYQDTFIKEY
jgi:hypothetical protein